VKKKATARKKTASRKTSARKTASKSRPAAGKATRTPALQVAKSTEVN
jgi:hypothetical protein